MNLDSNQARACCFATLVALFVGPGRIRAELVLPIAQGGVVGVGTTIHVDTGPFIAKDLLIPQTVRVAIDEYDLNAFPSTSIVSARLVGTIFVNNSFDTGTRIIDIEIYGGNGQVDTGDFSVTATSVDTIRFAPPAQASVSFNIDVTPQIQAMRSAGSQFIGFRYFPINAPSAASVLADDRPPILSFTVVPEPSGLLLGAVGITVLLAGAGMRRPLIRLGGPNT